MSLINYKENVHIWEGIQKNSVNVSLEGTKTFLTFSDKDSAINYLYLNGFKDSARQLNKEGV